jgi:hypothetical protein
LARSSETRIVSLHVSCEEDFGISAQEFYVQVSKQDKIPDISRDILYMVRYKEIFT